MKRVFLTLVMALSVLCVRAQEDKVLMTIDGKPVMLSEFQYIYEKNSQEAAGSQKSLDEYLDLLLGADRATKDNVAAFEQLTKKIEGTDYSLMDFFKYDKDLIHTNRYLFI